jgi:hypothetical protein
MKYWELFKHCCSTLGNKRNADRRYRTDNKNQVLEREKTKDLYTWIAQMDKRASGHRFVLC